jgi:TonB family protein
VLTARLHILLFVLIAAVAAAQTIAPYRVCKSDESDAGGTCATSPRAVNPTPPSISNDQAKNRIEGTVIIELVVTPDGAPHDMKVIQGLCHGLDEQASAAVELWHFEPGTVQGKPVPVKTDVYVRFGNTNGPAFPGTVAFEDADKLYSEALNAQSAGDCGTAIQLATRVIQLFPQHWNAWNLLGWCYMDLDDLAKAESAFKRQIEVSPRHKYAYNNLGIVYSRRREYDAAIVEFRKQLEFNPGYDWPLVNIVMSLQEEKKYKEAIAAASDAIKAAPNNASLYTRLLDCYLALGMQDEAAKTLDKAASLTSTGWNGLAWTLARHNVQLERAEKYAKLDIAVDSASLTAISLDPLTPHVYSQINSIGATWDTLGWILFLRGDTSSAEKYLLASWSLSPDATIGDHLAQLYEKLGRKDEALKYSVLSIAALREMPFPQTDDLDAAANARERIAKQMSPGQAKKSIEDARKSLHSADSIGIANPSKQAGKAEFAILQAPEASKSQARLMAGDQTLATFADTVTAQAPRVSLPGDQDLDVPRWGSLNCPDAAAPCSLTIATSRQAIVDQRQSQLKASAVPAMTTPGAYSSESLGIALQLPEGWSKSGESVADSSTLAKVFFSKNNSLCSFTIVRYRVQATEDTFNKLIESELKDRLDDMRELSTASVVRDGLTGVRSVINYEDQKVEWHAVIETFTAGDLHYRLIAEAPLDDFQRNSAELDKLFASVRFPQLHVTAKDLQ